MPAQKRNKAKKLGKLHIRRVSNVLTITGIIFIVLAAGILILTYYPVLNVQLQYTQRTRQYERTGQYEKASKPVNTMLGIMIPKIGANASIIPNVDPYDSYNYQQALTKGVAHAKGTALPGGNGNSFLFSHSSVNFYEATRYNSVFYLLSKLTTGDEIFIYLSGTEYVYTVTGTRIVSPADVSYLTGTSEIPTLTLMTCWPPGTTYKRLIVLATLR